MHLEFFTRTLKLIISKKEWNKDITVACCDICCGNGGGGGGGGNDFGVDDDGGGDGLKRICVRVLLPKLESVD